MAKDRNKLPIKRKKKIIVTLSVVSILAVVGSVSGTYAWYEYEARAGLKFHGTTIGDSSDLEVGLFSNAYLPDASAYGLVRDENDPTLYWATGELTSEALLYYSECNGFAGKKLSPTSSGMFSEGEDFFLKPAPACLMNPDASARADKINYFYLPMAFKLTKTAQSNTGSKIIILNDVEATGVGLVNQSLRMHFKSNVSNFIYNPTQDDSGFDTVGGILDLDLDGYYDVGSDGKEYVYGEYEQIKYKDEPSEDSEPIEEELRTTFNGAHKGGTYAIDKDSSVFSKAQYLGNSSVIGERILARTEPNDRYARLDLTIYLEGWSPYMNQLEENNYFSTKLTFELADF